MSHNAITQYYVNQAGSGMNQFYVGSTNQRGYGLGSMLGGLFRRVLPFLRKGAEAVGKQAVVTGSSILSDIASGQDPRTSVKKRAAEAGSRLADKLKRKADEMHGSGIKRRKTTKPRQLMRVARRVNIAHPPDIFHK